MGNERSDSLTYGARDIYGVRYGKAYKRPAVFRVILHSPKDAKKAVLRIFQANYNAIEKARVSVLFSCNL